MNVSIKAVAVFLILLIASGVFGKQKNSISRSRLTVVHKVVPCNLELRMSIESFGELKKHAFPKKASRLGSHDRRFDVPSDSLLIIPRNLVSRTFIRLTMINKSVTDTFLVPVPFGKSGIVLFQVFQRKDGVWTKIKFDNEDGQCQSADGLVEPGQTDSRYLQPINMDFDEVVDGEYYIEGIYRKTCVGENTIMHTNKVFFQVKN